MEDDPSSASALTTILQRRGFEVTAVATIAQAMLRLAGQPAFVILDLMLPDGDGVEVLRAIRQSGMKSRVIVTTAMSDPDRLRLVADLKPDLLLRKPIDLSLLLSSLKPVN